MRKEILEIIIKGSTKEITAFLSEVGMQLNEKNTAEVVQKTLKELANETQRISETM